VLSVGPRLAALPRARPLAAGCVHRHPPRQSRRCSA